MADAQPHKLTIVGCGPGSPDYLTEAGRRAIAGAAVLAGSARLLDLYATASQERIRVGSDVEGVLEVIASKRERGKVVVLVSGDPGLCSLARPVLRRFGRDACEVLPGVSSVQLAFARLGLDWQDARIVSAHKGIPDITPEDLAGYGTVAILAGHRTSQGWIADMAASLGNERSLVVCEDLSLETERIRRVPVGEFRRLDLSTRTIVLLMREEVPW
jgi:precorrin-6y C5,15-methyltransferase (decarboxylating) CbiE subunit